MRKEVAALADPHTLLHTTSKPEAQNKNIFFNIGRTKATKNHTYKETRRICEPHEASQEMFLI